MWEKEEQGTLGSLFMNVHLSGLYSARKLGRSASVKCIT